MNIWIKVKAGQLSIEQAIAMLTKVGATNTQTYRRVMRLFKKFKEKANG